MPRLTVDGSMRAGIAFVHQELNLFDNLTAAANIFIGREPLRGGPLRLIDERELTGRRGRCSTSSAPISTDTPVASLSLAQMQLVEIAKALSLKARLVIMDEPTSSLTASRDRAAARRDRTAEGRGRRRHLHLAPARRGRALSPTASSCCATASASASWPRRDRCRRR